MPVSNTRCSRGVDCTVWIPALIMPEPDRAETARVRTEPALRRLCAEHKVSYPPAEILLVGIKSDKVLQVWANGKKGARLKLLKSYSMLAASGVLGPKRKEGDLQVPEGRYKVVVFNPESRFHLSMGLNYPNSDDIKWADREKPGGEIYIHGNQVSIGCMAMGDTMIEEIYTLCKASLIKPVKVDIFPFAMTEKNMAWAREEFPASDTDRWRVWSALKKRWDSFQKRRR